VVLLCYPLKIGDIVEACKRNGLKCRWCYPLKIGDIVEVLMTARRKLPVSECYPLKIGDIVEAGEVPENPDSAKSLLSPENWGHR
jgi:hypothetical protein